MFETFTFSHAHKPHKMISFASDEFSQLETLHFIETKIFLLGWTHDIQFLAVNQLDSSLCFSQ